jgi:hypothetical protein
MIINLTLDVNLEKLVCSSILFSAGLITFDIVVRIKNEKPTKFKD